MKLKTISPLFIVLLCLVFNSCMTTKTSSTGYKEEQGKEYVYDRKKQAWIFWGIIPLGRASAKTPEDGTFEVVTKFRFSDAIINIVTLGIVNTYSITIKDKKPDK